MNRDNSQAVAQRFYEYCLRRNVFDWDFLIDANEAEQTGDTVKLATVFENGSYDGGQNYIAGQIEKLSLRLGNKNIKARGIIRGD